MKDPGLQTSNFDSGLSKIQIRLTYSLEWCEHGERHGKAVPDFATVAEEARLKAFEVEALKAG
jgi:hypothetical protein